MAKHFDYCAFWTDAQTHWNRPVHWSRQHFSCQVRPHISRPSTIPGVRTARKQREVKAASFPAHRAKAIAAIRNAADDLATLLAESRFRAPLAGIWPPSAPQDVARTFSRGLNSELSAAQLALAWARSPKTYIDQFKRSAWDAESAIRSVVAQLELRPDVAEHTYEWALNKLRRSATAVESAAVPRAPKAEPPELSTTTPPAPPGEPRAATPNPPAERTETLKHEPEGAGVAARNRWFREQNEAKGARDIPFSGYNPRQVERHDERATGRNLPRWYG